MKSNSQAISIAVYY